jgi:hypothetical protein
VKSTAVMLPRDDLDDISPAPDRSRTARALSPTAKSFAMQLLTRQLRPTPCILCSAVHIAATRYVFSHVPPPSLGVSSLDLGRLHCERPLFLPCGFLRRVEIHSAAAR